jgi:hypothetical protein
MFRKFYSIFFLKPVSAPSRPKIFVKNLVELGSRLPYLLPDLGFLEFDRIHSRSFPTGCPMFQEALALSI